MMSSLTLKPKAIVSCLGILTLLGSASLSVRTCQAQQQFLGQQAPATPEVKWVEGPGKVSLEKFAEINIPAGYRFTDRNGASVLLQRTGNPNPKNLVGILTPISGKWFAVVEYADIGWMKGADKDKLDPNALLKAIRRTIARQDSDATQKGAPVIDGNSADWELKPTFQAAENKLEWALKTGTGNRAGVNYCASLLGRHGILAITVAAPYKEGGFDITAFQALAKGISFQKGERYSDFQEGDKLAATHLGELVASDTELGSEPLLKSKKALWAAGIAGGAVIIIGGAALLLFARRPRRRRSSRISADSRKPTMAMAVAGQSGLAGEAAPANGETSSETMPALQRNGKTSKNGERKRKKHFSFYAFHSDMVMNLTRWNYTGGFGTFSEYPDDANGSSLSYRNSDSQSLDPQTPALATEISKLIDSQQKLIEGQRRLIEEQNRLIQEKNKLIDAETKVLEKQSELLEEQQLL